MLPRAIFLRNNSLTNIGAVDSYHPQSYRVSQLTAASHDLTSITNNTLIPSQLYPISQKNSSTFGTMAFNFHHQSNLQHQSNLTTTGVTTKSVIKHQKKSKSGNDLDYLPASPLVQVNSQFHDKPPLPALPQNCYNIQDPQNVNNARTSTLNTLDHSTDFTLETRILNHNHQMNSKNTSNLRNYPNQVRHIQQDRADRPESLHAIDHQLQTQETLQMPSYQSQNNNNQTFKSDNFTANDAPLPLSNYSKSVGYNEHNCNLSVSAIQQMSRNQGHETVIFSRPGRAGFQAYRLPVFLTVL